MILLDNIVLNIVHDNKRYIIWNILMNKVLDIVWISVVMDIKWRMDNVYKIIQVLE